MPAIILKDIADGLAISGVLELQRPFSLDDLERGLGRLYEIEPWQIVERKPDVVLREL